MKTEMADCTHPHPVLPIRRAEIEILEYLRGLLLDDHWDLDLRETQCSDSEAEEALKATIETLGSMLEFLSSQGSSKTNDRRSSA